MSIYDREYMDESDEAMNAAGRRHTAVVVLVLINAVVWIAWRLALDSVPIHSFMKSHFLVSLSGVLHELKLHTLLTACFSHIELYHILGNMLFLWILGHDVERIYGYRNFFFLYAFTGIVASLAHVGFSFFKGDIPALGASGSVMGIAVVAAIFDPNKPVSIFGLITLPLRLLVIIYVIMDVLGALDGKINLVGNAAHLGGAAAGYLFWKWDLRVFSSPGREQVGIIYRLRRWFRRKPKLRLVEKEPQELPREAVVKVSRSNRVSARAASQAASGRVDPATGERVDQLLMKISQGGLDSLTAEERDFLNESSKKYKK